MSSAAGEEGSSFLVRLTLSLDPNGRPGFRRHAAPCRMSRSRRPVMCAHWGYKDKVTKKEQTRHQEGAKDKVTKKEQRTSHQEGAKDKVTKKELTVLPRQISLIVLPQTPYIFPSISGKTRWPCGSDALRCLCKKISMACRQVSTCRPLGDELEK